MNFKNFTVEKEKEIRQLELELQQLPTEDELRQYAAKKRVQQQELDDLNKNIKDLEAELDNVDDDENNLLQKIRAAQQSNVELKKSSEPPQPAKQHTHSAPFKLESDQVRLNSYRSMALSLTRANKYVSI